MERALAEAAAAGAPTGLADGARFEVIRHAGRYEVRLKGLPIATSCASAQWVIVSAEKGNRAEFHDCRVERPE